MKKIVFCTFLLCFCTVPLLHGAYHVILPQKMSRQEKTAYEELKLFLEQSVREKVFQHTEGTKAVPAGKRIYLGNTLFAKQAGFDQKKFSAEEWCVRAVNKNTLILTGGNVRGVIYAVLEFLESELGIIFAHERFTHIPNKKNYQWKTTLSLRGKPAVRDRGIYSYFTEHPQYRVRFMLRNRLNLFCDEGIRKEMKEYNISPVFGAPRFCHNFYNYTKDLGKADEDCFSMDASGKRIRPRNASGPGQICFTNPKTRRIFLTKLRAYIRADRKKYPDNPPDIYTIDPNDSPLRCMCKPCKAMEKKYKAYSGVLLHFVNYLAKEIAKEYPDVRLLTSAYMFASKPPVGLKIEKNVIVRIAQLGKEWGGVGIRDTMRDLAHRNNRQALAMLQNWAKLSSIGIWDYWILYDGKSLLPSLSVDAIGANAKVYEKLKVVNLFAECESAHTASFHALRLYVGAQTMSKPNLETKELVRRFIKVYYGKASSEMLAYYNFLHRSLYNSGNMAGNTPLSMRNELNDAFFQQANTLLDKAVKAASSDKTLLKRVRKERISIDYGYLERYQYLAKKDPSQRKKIMARLRKNFDEACSPEVMGRGGRRKHMNSLKNYLQGLQVSVPIPARFASRQVIADFTWPRISRKTRGVIADDPAAAGGKCFRVTRPQNNTTVPLGAYAQTAKQHLRQVYNKNVKPDGKYRFYSTGVFTMKERSFVWTHWTWGIQADLTPYYDRSGLNNKVEAFVSVKITNDKNYPYSVDRIIVVKAP